MLTREEIKRRVSEVIEIGNKDPEKGRLLEDNLHRDVLRHIAVGCGMTVAKEMAEEALKTKEGDFARWY